MGTISDHYPLPSAKRQRLDRIEIQHHRLKNMLLIYADDQLEENSDDFQKIFVELRNRINDVKLFKHAPDCIQFFNQLKNEKVIAVMSGAISQDLLPKIDSLPQVYAIYLIDIQSVCIGQWFKVKSVHDHIVPIYSCIAEDIKQYQENGVPVIFGSIKNGRLDPSFMFTRLLLKVLLRMKYDQRSLEEYSSFFGTKYASNKVMLNILERFPETYCSEDAITWYTQHAFVFQEVNRACRLLQADSIIHMGFLIRDLCTQIKVLHEEQMSSHSGASFHLYRGQGMSIEDFEKLNSEKGQLIAFNGFVSTSKDEDVARMFAESNSSGQSKVGVLFDIKIDPKMNSVSFAELKAQSAFGDEAEYLFSMHSVFRTGTISCFEGNDSVYRVELIQTTDDDPELRQLTDAMELELSHLSDDETLRALSMRIGEDESVEKRCLASLHQDIPWDDKLRCYQELAAIKRDQGMYAKALDYSKKAMVIQRRVFPDNDCILGALHQFMGTIYTVMGKHSDALTHYERSLKLFEKYCISNDISLATCYNNCAVTCYELQKWSNALSYYEKALSVMNDHYPANHLCLSKIYVNMTAVDVAMGNHSRALEYGQKGLEILEKALPADHSWLAEAHHNIGATHSAMEEPEKALLHYQQVLRIFKERGRLDPRVLGATYNSMGLIYSRRRNYDGALSKFKDALETFQLLYPNEANTYMAIIYINIGDTHYEMKKYTHASSEYEKALLIMEKTLPDGLDGLFNVYANLGISYLMEKNYQKSIDYFQQALDSIKKTQPDNYEALADIYIYMGGTYHELGECIQTSLCFVEAMDIQRRHQIPLHPIWTDSSDHMISRAIELVRETLPAAH